MSSRSLLAANNFLRYEHPSAAWGVVGVMVVWTGLAIAGYERPSARAWPLLAVDLAVTAGCLLASRWVVGTELLAHGTPTLDRDVDGLPGPGRRP